jgi:hypothetical protein
MSFPFLRRYYRISKSGFISMGFSGGIWIGCGNLDDWAQYYPANFKIKETFLYKTVDDQSKEIMINHFKINKDNLCAAV